MNRIEPFDYNNTFALRGVMMMLIVFHHLYGAYMGKLGFALPFFEEMAGYTATGVFFFLAGYGFVHRYDVWEARRMRLSLSHRAWQLLSPWLFAFFFRLVVLTSLGIFKWNWMHVIKDFFTLSVVYDGIWFYKAFLFIHIISVLTIYLSKSLRITALTTFVVAAAFFIFCHYHDIGFYWYFSILNYGIGMFFAIAGKEAITRHRVTILLIAAALFTAMLITNHRSLISVPFAVFCFYAIQFVNISNPLLFYIGKNSLLFYMIHTIYMAIFCNNDLNIFVAYAFILFSTILTIWGKAFCTKGIMLMWRKLFCSD